MKQILRDIVSIVFLIALFCGLCVLIYKVGYEHSSLSNLDQASEICESYKDNYDGHYSKGFEDCPLIILKETNLANERSQKKFESDQKIVKDALK